MKSIRHNVFETNSSSCHSLSIFERSAWDSFEKGDSFVYMPYSVSEAKIISLEDTRKAIIDMIKEAKSRTFNDLPKVLSDLEKNDSLIKEIIENKYSVGDILGHDFDDILDDLEIDNYDHAYGEKSEIYGIEEFDSHIFKKDYCVVVMGERCC